LEVARPVAVELLEALVQAADFGGGQVAVSGYVLNLIREERGCVGALHAREGSRGWGKMMPSATSGKTM